MIACVLRYDRTIGRVRAMPIVTNERQLRVIELTMLEFR